MTKVAHAQGCMVGEGEGDVSNLRGLQASPSLKSCKEVSARSVLQLQC